MEIEILNKQSLLSWCQQIRIPEEGWAALTEMAEAITLDPELWDIFARFYEKTTINNEWHREWSPLPLDQVVENRFGERTSLFYLLGYLAALPSARDGYERRGISMDIFRETMWDIPFYYLEDTDVHGNWCFEHFPWIWRHLTLEIFRLGRLQFALIPFDYGVTAFRSLNSGKIILLGDPQVDLRADGYAEGAGGKPSGGEIWQAVCEERSDGWFGNPISPYGRALREPLFLPRNEWQVALRKGDTVLDIHIPRGKTLTAQDCKDSFQRANNFFEWQKPDQQIKASYCHTWFFTPQLQKILGPESSIVQFQREFYLYPFAGGPGFLWNFVFGGKYKETTSAPRDTTLRRAVIAWLERGDELFDLPGVMFHSVEEWGTQPYMTDWDNLPKSVDA